MRKFFLTVVLFVVAQLAMGQCYDINNFTPTSSPSACPQDGEVVVAAPTLTSPTCSTATFTVELGLPGGGVPRTESVVTGQTVTFGNLSPGVYSVILHDASGNTSTSKTVPVTSSFRPMNVTLGTLCGAQMSKTTTMSSAFSLDNGTIRYTIQGGTGVGLAFDVSLEDASGNQLVAPQRVTRTSVTADLAGTLAKVLPTDRIPSGVTVYLVVKNVNTGIPSNCDEEKKVEVKMPPAVYMPGTFGLRWAALTLRTGANCKYSFGINISRADGQTVHYQAGCYNNDILTHFRANGRAKVEVLNKGITHYLDGTSATNPRDGWFNGWGYRTGDLFENGDELRITIDDGFGNTLVRHFKLDTSTPATGSGMSLQNQSSAGSSCDPYLRFKVNFSNLTKTYPDITAGGTISINPYQWQYSYTRENWQAGLFKYEVEKLVSGAYSPVTHIEKDFDVIDVTSSGAGTYRVRLVPTSGCPAQTQLGVVDYVTTDRFDAAFNSIEKNYGIYDGTTSFRMPLGATSFFYNHPTDPTGTPSKAKLTITRVDGQTSISFPTSLFLEQTVTKMVNFPIVLPLVPSSLHPNGVNNVGLGDLPPGEYIFKLEDACGSGTKTITLSNQMSLRDASYTVVKGCETSAINYTLGTQAGNRLQTHVQLQRKNASGNFVNVPGEVRNFSPNGSFSNLETGTYRLMTFNYYYVRSTTGAFLGEMWTMLPPFANLPQTGLKTGNPYVNEEVRGYSPEIEITSRSMNPFVSSVSCGTTNGSGLVFVDISQSDLPDEDITYILYKELSAGGVQTVVTSVTVSSTVTSHHFANLSDGKYKVGIKNNCGEYLTQTQEVNASALQPPTIISSKDICPGTTATMEVSVSPSLYDIEWFRINPSTGAVEGPFGINQKIYTETVYTQTTYLANVKLKGRFNCGSNVNTPTTIVTMIPDVTPPAVVDFPADQNLTLTAGTCTVSVTWTEPTVTDTCSVTVTSTHTSPAVFGEGVHSVMYTFTDASGNSTTRTLQIAVKAPTMESSLEGKYTDGATTELTQLTIDQLFYYELKYSNVATETISTATLTVQLPLNTNVQALPTVDISGAGAGTTFIYNATSKTYDFTIPNYPATGGVIKIPLQLTGGHTEAAKPCMNLQEITATMTYNGGGATCLQTKIATTSSTIEIDTSTYTRTHMQCTQGAAITATTGFNSYQWYQGTTPLVGGVSVSYTPSASGEYRVAKTILCGTKTVTSFEIIDYHISANIVSVTVVKDKQTCVELGQINVTAAEGTAPYQYMARISTGSIPTEVDFTTPSPTDVVTAFGNSVLDLPQGIYKLYVLDSAGCIAAATGVYTITTALMPTINTVQADVCNASSAGYNATVMVTFGDPTLSHSYVLDGGTPVAITTNTFTLTGLTSGIHTLTLIDSNTCSDTRSFTIDTPVTLGAANLVRPLSCVTPTTQITLSSISGGTGSYTYEFGSVNVGGVFTLISSGVATTTSVVENISSAGEYMFRVKDSAMILAGCTPIESNVVTVTAPQLPGVASITTTSASCYGHSTGSIQITASPTTLVPITFRITQLRDLATGVVSSVTILPTATTSTTASFGSLVGTLSGVEYTIELTGNNGCASIATATVTSASPIVATSALSATPFSCVSGVQEAVLSFDVTQVSGGQTPYTWEFFEQSGTSVGGINASTVSITNIAGGTYYVEVRDASGCATRTNEVTIAPAQSLVASITTTSASCYGHSTGSIQITASPTTLAPITFRITQLRDLATGVVSSVTILPTATTSTTASFGSLVGTLISGVEYTIELTGNNGCASVATATVASASPIVATSALSATPFSCVSGVQEAVLSFDVTQVSGGQTPYTWEFFEQSGTSVGGVNASTVSITNMAGGIYYVEVRDASGCATRTNEVTIAPAQSLVASITTTSASCYGHSTGSIQITASPTTLAPITFRITQLRDLATGVVSSVTILPTATTSTTASFGSLVGTLISGVEYTIELTGNNGCASVATATVASASPIVATSALSTTPFSCVSGVQEAVLSFDVTQVSGGQTPYTWEFFEQSGTSVGGINASTVSITNIAGGTYYVEVRDASGCATRTNEVTVMPTFTLSNVVVTPATPITCLANEQISVSVTATPNYVPNTLLRFTAVRQSDGFAVSETYSSTASSAMVSYTFTGLLPAGEYVVTVENLASSCSVTASHTVADLTNKFEIKVSNEMQPSCYQGNDGGATFTFVDRKPTLGGNQATNGFTYTVTHLVTNQISTGTVAVGTATAVISNLSEGNYRLDAVSLANGCSVSTLFEVPQAPLQMVVRATASPTSSLVSCVTNQGEISVSVLSGGKAPYVINLTSATQNATQTLAQSGDSVLFTGLSVGTYTITLTDALGCSVYTGTQSVALRMPDPLVASVTSTNVSCNGNNDGRILITNVSGGSGTNIFTYTIDNGIDPAITQSVNIFENLKPGIYAVIVADSMGCQTVTTAKIEEPTLIQAAIDIAGSDRLLCYNTANAYVRVTAQGGTQPYTIDIYSSETNLRVNPVSYVTPAPSNPILAPQVAITTDPILASGTYYARVLDARGCAVTTTEFTVETLPNAEPREIYQEKDCRSNVIYDPIVVRFAEAIDATNTYYTLNGVRSSFTRVEGNIGYIETYDRTIATQTITFEISKTHSDGSQTKQCFSTVWTIDIEETQSLTAVEVPNTNLNTIQVAGIGGVAPYSYTFNNQSQGDNPIYVLTLNDPGYFDNVTNQTIKQVLVEVTDALGCTYSLTISAVYYDVEVPNFFTPDGDGRNDTWKPKNLENYPKSRTYIYDRHGRRLATLAPNESWDGTHQGKHMPTGDYWYVLELNNVADTRRFYGNFTLYR